MTGDDVLLGILLLLPVALVVALLLFFRRTRALEKRLAWSRVVFGNILIGLCLLSLLAAGGEIYYRFLYDTTDSLAYTKVAQRWLHRYYRENSALYRDNVQYTRMIPPGKRRVSFLGDSFTVGHGVKVVEDRFVNRIRAAHPEWDVQMLARNGLDTTQELELMEMVMKGGYEVDVVVLVYCLNDVGDLIPEWKQTVQKIFADEDSGGWIRRHSFLFDTLYHRIKRWRDPAMQGYFDFVEASYRGPVWNEEQKYLMGIQSMVEKGGGRLLVVIFPFLHAVGPDYKFGSVHELLRHYWAGQNIPCLDLLDVFSNQPPSKITVNRYDAHPNEYAHELAAEAIEPFIVTNLVSRNSMVGKERHGQ